MLEDEELMAVRIRWSALDEANAMMDPSTVCEETPSDALFRRNIRANTCIFVPQCKIFLGQIAVPNNYGFFQDPDQDVGDPGDVVIAQDANGNFGLSAEMITLGEMAHDHWSSHERGILAIAINRFILADGSPIGVRGFGMPPTATQRPLVYIVDPAFIPSGVDSEHIFAHEVGHSLGLCHPEECDQLNGESATQNLMNPSGSANSTRLVESQCITARTTYPSVFESPAGIEAQPSLTIRHRRDSAPTSSFGDALIQSVQMSSQASAESALSLSLRTRWPTGGETVSFWMSLDLDGDAATGLDAGMIVPQGAHEGADLIVSFASDGAGNVIGTELHETSGSAFVPLAFPTDGLQLRSDTVLAHSTTDSGCVTHPAFDEISLEIHAAAFEEIGHSKPTSFEALGRIRIQGTTRSHRANGSEFVDTFRSAPAGRL